LAFTAGLLHDVGKIVLASAEGDAYAALSQEHANQGSLLQEAETTKFGFGHGEVGARLLERWGVPEDISVPVHWHHHSHWVQPYERLCAIVSLANWLAHVADSPAPEIQCDSPEAVTAAVSLDLTEEDVTLLLQDSREDVARFTGLLHA
jgi:HD-like signal output (HDOD) protein